MTEEAHSSTHPPLPPTTEDLRRSWLRLLRSRRVGPATFYRLLSEHGSAQNALEALPKMARSAGQKGYETCPADAVNAEMKAAKAAKARLLCFGDPDYPALLAQLKDAPPALWAIGNLDLLKRPMIAIVGARNASSLGTRMARALAHDLAARGYVVVSGLARGVDTAAHQAALSGGTVSVLAGGVDVIYPSENTRLGQDIYRQGLMLSEQPMGLAPQARHFPKRNRIIAGLAQAVVVVEAAAKSGSLITARDALDMGREVLAVPGHPFDARASGCNMLIRDGAQLVRNAEDVIAALPPMDSPDAAPSQRTGSTQRPRKSPRESLADLPPPPPERRNLRETAALHQQVLARLGPSPTPEDQLLHELAVAPKDLSSVLTELELDGEIDRHPGGMLSRPPGGKGD
ncbi:DNA-processing protein DprA [Phaeobacter sp. PT47_59]|uniref:DNA-processing protein DprA n=1 Tax=Phaeobacter sp. PT47_59 TaxID=3029979 RepID=UPI00238097F4|nr:DNA-processing protein DprA [Phaeobacter sp. PT47_59]MDE4173273.1 DNA-processing protein DprA [Phaeobacter sp. PT47_59]